MLNKNFRILSDEECSKVSGGEAITLATVCAVLSISILAIVVWKLFNSQKGSAQIPGGFKFTWSYLKNLVK